MKIDLTFEVDSSVMGFVASDVAEFSGKDKGDLGSRIYRSLECDIDSVEAVREVRERR